GLTLRVRSPIVGLTLRVRGLPHAEREAYDVNSRARLRPQPDDQPLPMVGRRGVVFEAGQRIRTGNRTAPAPWPSGRPGTGSPALGPGSGGTPPTPGPWGRVLSGGPRPRSLPP